MSAILIFLNLITSTAHAWVGPQPAVGQCHRSFDACFVTQRLKPDWYGLKCNQGVAVFHETHHRQWLPGPLAIPDLVMVKMTTGTLMNGYDVNAPVFEECEVRE